MEEEPEAEEDIDPFAQSYRKGESSRMTATMTTSLGSQGQQQQQQGEERMLSSRELNMKSIFLNPDNKERDLSDSESEGENDESQLLPGSGVL